MRPKAPRRVREWTRPRYYAVAINKASERRKPAERSEPAKQVRRCGVRAAKPLDQECARPRSGGPAAQHRVYLALLPSGPDAVRRLNLHRVRTAVRRTTVFYRHSPCRPNAARTRMPPPASRHGTLALPLTFYKSGSILSIVYKTAPWRRP